MSTEPIVITGRTIKRLREKAKAMSRGPGMGHCHTLNAVAHEVGFKDWSSLIRHYNESQKQAGSAA